VQLSHSFKLQNIRS